MPKSTLRRIIDELPGVTGTTSATGRAPGSASSGLIRAANVLFTAYRTIVASNVQRAIELLEDQKLDLSGGSMSGGLYLADDPADDYEAATKRYVDTYMAEPNEGTTALRVDTLAGVPMFHVVHETESGRVGVPTAPGIDWTPAGVRIAPAVLNYAQFETVTGTHTAGEKPFIYADGTFTITLPPAAVSAGRYLTIANIGTGTVTVDGNGSETINGSLTHALSVQYATVRMHCNGVGWIRL